MATKKTTKRSKTKYPGLDPSVNSKKRWEYMDQDYADKLTDKDKEYLSNFNEEYLSGNFQHKGKKFHKTKKERKTCYDRNNARNRDLYTLNKTGALKVPGNWIGSCGFKGKLEEFQKENGAKGVNNTEDEMLDNLDKKITDEPDEQ